VAWDATRPVPWQRLIREWLIYVAIMAVVFVVFFRERNLFGIFAGLLVSGPLYLAFGWVLAKYGYERKSLRELRAQPRSSRSSRSTARSGTADATDVARPKPAPTKRTGGNQPNRPGKRRR
jgi:hypothetical protein